VRLFRWKAQTIFYLRQEIATRNSRRQASHHMRVKPRAGWPQSRKAKRVLDLGAPEALALGEALVVDLLEGILVLLGEPIERRLPGAVGTVQSTTGTRGIGHARWWSTNRGWMRNSGLSLSNSAVRLPGGDWPSAGSTSPPPTYRQMPALLQSLQHLRLPSSNTAAAGSRPPRPQAIAAPSPPAPIRKGWEPPPLSRLWSG